MHVAMAKYFAVDANQVVRLWAFRFQAKYWMSYKWMEFDVRGCGTGPCRHTVMIWGTCLRKNQLGNIALGLIGTLFPPGSSSTLGMVNTPMEVMEYAYDINDGRYPRDHPHAANYGKYAGQLRRDNLMAFRAGSFIAAQMLRQGSADPSAWTRIMPAVLKSEPFQRDLKEGFLKLYADKGGKGRFTASDLTWIPEFGGFDTRKCKKCPRKWKPTGNSVDAFNSLLDQYANSHLLDWANGTRVQKLEAFVQGQQLFTGFDGWLREQHEDYTK